MRGGPPAPQFIKIKVCPKGIAGPAGAERAADRLHESISCWWSLRGGRKAHVRHEKARVHHAARRRGCGVAACHGGYSCSACLLRSKRRKLLSANGRRRAQKILRSLCG